MKITNGYRILDKISLVLVDAGVILFSLSFAFYIRFNSGLIPFGNELPAIGAYVKLSLLVLPMWLFLNFFYKLYSDSVLNIGTEEYRRIVHTSALGIVTLLIISFLLKKSYARGWVILSWFVITFLMLVTRFFIRKIKHIQNIRGLNTKKAIIIGNNEEGRYIMERIERAPHLGLKIIGFLGKEQPANDNEKILGKAEEIEKVINENPGIGTVILVTSALSSKLMQDIYRLLNKLEITALISPSLVNILSSRINVQPIAGVPLISIERIEFKGIKLMTKRLLDITGTVLGLTVLLPVLLIISLVVRVDSRGKALFVQERVGRKGETFMMYKFRTMHTDAEKQLDKLQHLNEAEGKIFKMKDDPRVTRAGKFLRKYSLDELPQIINVLKGEMSLVGPRPPLPDEVAGYDDWDRQRLETYPGMTGLWQVSGRSGLPFDEMVKLDVFYIENWSPLFDIYILLKTIPEVLRSSGAY